LLVLVELLLLIGGLPALDRGAGESLRVKLEELLELLMLLIIVDKIFGVPSMISSNASCPRSGEEDFRNIYINVFPAPRDREVPRTKERQVDESKLNELS